MRGVFQSTIVDEAGNVVPECDIEVRDESSGELVQVYDAFEDGDTLGNPLVSDENGFIRFYVDSGLYRILASSGEFEREWRHVLIGAGPLADEVEELLETEIESSSYTGALTGLTSTVNSTVQVRKVGDLICLSWPAGSGTSNSTALTMTGLPEGFRPNTAQSGLVTRVTDNGTTQFGTVSVGTNGTLTFNTGAAGGAFTGSGTKGMPAGSITYPIL